MNLVTTSIAMAGGVASSAGTAEQHKITIGGTWVAGDTFQVVLTDSSTGLQYTVGLGDFTGQVPAYVFTYKNKLYFLAGAKAFFSAVGSPTVFNDPTGLLNGNVGMSSEFGNPENLVAIASYQGKLAFFSDNTIQIWTIDADPANWAQSQVLDNIGTSAPGSVRSLGDADVLFLSQSGVRSLRARDASSNAVPTDLGSPVDSLVQADLIAIGAAAVDTQAGVEPLTKRYMLALNGKIYVLSYFPASEITAWSLYTPVDNNGAAFTPEKFVVFQRRLYLRDTAGKLYLFGGADNKTYDATQMIIELPLLDDDKPVQMKEFASFDGVFKGKFKVEFGADPSGGVLEEVATIGDAANPDSTKDSTYGERYTLPGRGLRFKMKLTSSNETTNTPCVLSELVVKYKIGNAG